MSVPTIVPTSDTVRQMMGGGAATMSVHDHYWVIGNSSSQVYQSKTNTLVAQSDIAYTEWMNAHGMATPIASEAELAEVLRNRGSHLPDWLLTAQPTFIQPTPTTYTQDQLFAYTAYARQQKYAGDIVVNGLPFSTDPISLGGLNGAMLYTSDKVVDAFSWKLPDGTFITLTTAQIKDLQSAVASFGQACFICEDDTLTKIENGEITTLPQIDAEFAAVSNVFTSVGTFEARHRRK